MAKSIYSAGSKLLLGYLREAREAAGLKQAELGKLLGKTQSTIAKIEKGERRLDVVEFLEVADALGIDPHAILKKVRRELAKRR